MTSDEIIEALDLTAKLMELHDENAFKAKAYANASFRLSKLRFDFEGKSPNEIEAIEGIGKGIASKIIELQTTGSTAELQTLLEKTPRGVIDVLSIKGLGPKKVRQLWHELSIESTGELLYACNENRLVTLKGFGDKTQAQVKKNIEFKLANQHKFHFAAIEGPLNNFIRAVQTQEEDLQIAVVGQMARKCEVIDEVEVLLDEELKKDYTPLIALIPLPVKFIFCSSNEFYYKLVEFTAAPLHLEKINFSELSERDFYSEEEVYDALSLPYFEPELREGLFEVEQAKRSELPTLIELSDLKGILHNHSTYSDGVHTLKEMADHCKQLGYSYFGICDHSKSAFYAQGLSEGRVLEQQKEIDALNRTYSDFTILKGIESDILNDGSLDYEEDILKTFDFVVASVHSNLKMSKEKATERLLRAIENPFTSILGHPTGRLLLAREGYPIDHKKIIDACAANKVSIELNAHPYRLDIDWRWIPYCIEKGVLVSINPDAHHKEGLLDMYYGVCVARKGLLAKENCLNALTLPQLVNWFKK